MAVLFVIARWWHAAPCDLRTHKQARGRDTHSTSKRAHTRAHTTDRDRYITRGSARPQASARLGYSSTYFIVRPLARYEHTSSTRRVCAGTISQSRPTHGAHISDTTKALQRRRRGGARRLLPQHAAPSRQRIVLLPSAQDVMLIIVAPRDSPDARSTSSPCQAQPYFLAGVCFPARGSISGV